MRARKIASAVGYVGTELAKEAPYYVGAFGARPSHRTRSPRTKRIIFLGGANLGAAAYEYGLARVVRAVLHRRDCPAYASFETDWVPRDYLRDYYSVIEPDEHRTIAFFVDAIRDAEPDEPILYFGVGPTLHHVFLAARNASEIHLGDYLPANLQEIERWINRDPGAHDWRRSSAIRSSAKAGLADGGRDHSTRGTHASQDHAAARGRHPAHRSLGEQDTPQYGTVISAYCVDSATEDRSTWETYMERIVGLVRPGGTLLTAALRRSRGYLVGGKMFPSANVDEHDIRAVLERYFRREDLTIEVCELAEVESKGYSSIVLARAHHRGSCGGSGTASNMGMPFSGPGPDPVVPALRHPREWLFGAS